MQLFAVHLALEPDQARLRTAPGVGLLVGRVGQVLRVVVGRGIWHSEKNASPTDEVHFIQMWVLPDTESIDPGCQQMDINDQLAAGGLVPVESGQGHDAAISIQQKDAVLWAAR